jgi:4-carboxymuconolactone decarboxylase
MAKLPDPTQSLDAADRATFDHVAAARAHADGRVRQSEVYIRMFNNPGVAAKVAALGEHLRFNGTLPDEVRELIILRYSVRMGAGYEWSHHQRPAKLAGISQDVIDGLTAGKVPASLPDASQAALEAVDAVVALRSIPADVQQRIVAGHGVAGVVEVVALCGLYAIMSYMVTAFDIPTEEGLPKAPF